MYYLIIFILCISSIDFAMGQNADANEISRTDVSFFSNGLLIRGWLYKPESTVGEKLPVIVMAPGFSGTKECNYQFFASNFARAGFAVLLFDYPNFGESAGNVRGEADPWQQVQAYRDGITYVETLPAIDPERIGVWGGSYAGGHVLVVSAFDPRVKCLVAMTPFISGSYYVKQLAVESKALLYQQFRADRLSRITGGTPAKIPVASADDDQFCAVPSPHAWEFIQSFREYAPSFENSVTLKSLEMQLEYEPGYYVQHIGGKPKLFIVARNDEVVPEQLIVDAYNRAPEPKNLVYLDGHHFSPYMDKLQEASKLAVDWFKLYL
ncbi:MAG: alpha/beta hydrolase [Chitinophagales bacterium]|nr:alpha/beta hydrolase [Chitinophagales bacterium]